MIWSISRCLTFSRANSWSISKRWRISRLLPKNRLKFLESFIVLCDSDVNASTNKSTARVIPASTCFPYRLSSVLLTIPTQLLNYASRWTRWRLGFMQATQSSVFVLKTMGLLNKYRMLLTSASASLSIYARASLTQLTAELTLYFVTTLYQVRCLIWDAGHPVSRTHVAEGHV